MSYCSVTDVCNAFPQFQRNAPGSVEDSDIQGWIDDRKARIRAVLMSRQKYDPDTATLTTDQTNFLRALNRDGVIPDLINALAQAITLQPGEVSLGATHRKTFEATLQKIEDGLYDSFFQPEISRSTDVQSLFGGIAGAEVDPAQTPASANQTRFFGRSQVF